MRYHRHLSYLAIEEQALTQSFSANIPKFEASIMRLDILESTGLSKLIMPLLARIGCVLLHQFFAVKKC